MLYFCFLACLSFKFREHTNLLLWQVGVSTHTVRLVNEWLGQCGLTLPPQHVKSADLTIIEGLWSSIASIAEDMYNNTITLYFILISDTWESHMKKVFEKLVSLYLQRQ